jgi:hypothetical protein
MKTFAFLPFMVILVSGIIFNVALVQAIQHSFNYA